MSPLQRMAGGWTSISPINRIIADLAIGIAMRGAAQTSKDVFNGISDAVTKGSAARTAAAPGAAAADVGPSEAPASEREGE